MPSIIDFINCSGPDRIKILNYDVEDKQSNYKEKVPFMPDRCFRMVVCRPSGSVKLIFFWIWPIDCYIMTRYICMLEIYNRASANSG